MTAWKLLLYSHFEFLPEKCWHPFIFSWEPRYQVCLCACDFQVYMHIAISSWHFQSHALNILLRSRLFPIHAEIRNLLSQVSIFQWEFQAFWAVWLPSPLKMEQMLLLLLCWWAGPYSFIGQQPMSMNQLQMWQVSPQPSPHPRPCLHPILPLRYLPHPARCNRSPPPCSHSLASAGPSWSRGHFWWYHFISWFKLNKIKLIN